MTYTNLPGGTYHIWTYYSGDSNNAPSSSTPPIQITVSTGTSAVDFNVFSPNSTTGYYAAGANIGSIDYGTQLELSAYVTPSSDASTVESCITITTACALPSYTTPTGTVTFADSSSTINTAVLNAAGEAAYNPAFAVGAHSVTASYAGDRAAQAQTPRASPSPSRW